MLGDLLHRVHLQRQIEKHLRSSLPVRKPRATACARSRRIQASRQLQFSRSRSASARIPLCAADFDNWKALNGQSFTVVGVMPGSFQYRSANVKLWSLYALSRPLAPVSVFLVGLSLAASLIPARRATKGDPTTVLRCEWGKVTWVYPTMKLLLVLLCAAVACAQTVPIPPALFNGTVKHIDSGTLTLTIPDQDDVDISCTHKTHYYSGSQKIKRTDIKPGDRVTVETTLDLYLKPEAVNVRLLPPAKQ